MSACSILPSTIAAQYEVLRGAALGEVLPFKARSGLMLFRRRGMWGWVQTLTAIASSPQVLIDPPTAAGSAHGGHNAVVHVLATIATSIHLRRSP
ncbi:hypothetical protein A9Z06_17110 [Rhizobium sp. YK2]|nr:hypothetical protein A9Z06_17110 [Rhizobium sp. YK2]